MTTINQLVRKGRSKKTKKSKSPVLNVGFNSKKKEKKLKQIVHKNVVFVQELLLVHQRNQTQH